MNGYRPPTSYPGGPPGPYPPRHPMFPGHGGPPGPYGPMVRMHQRPPVNINTFFLRIWWNFMVFWTFISYQKRWKIYFYLYWLYYSDASADGITWFWSTSWSISKQCIPSSWIPWSTPSKLFSRSTPTPVAVHVRTSTFSFGRSAQTHGAATTTSRKLRPRTTTWAGQGKTGESSGVSFGTLKRSRTFCRILLKCSVLIFQFWKKTLNYQTGWNFYLVILSISSIYRLQPHSGICGPSGTNRVWSVDPWSHLSVIKYGRTPQ